MKIPSAISQNFITITIRGHAQQVFSYDEMVYARESFADPLDSRIASTGILTSSLVAVK
jgi:hypothetical protein